MPVHALVTPRLRLAPVTPAEAGGLLRLWTEPKVRRYLWDGAIVDRETVESIIADSEDSFREAGFGQWAVRLGDEPELVGFCGLRPFGDAGDIELLYGIAPTHWGRGFAVEAASAVLSHGFSYASLDAIVAEVDVPNRASIRVAEKLGLRFVREYEREGRPRRSYEIRRAEWRRALDAPP